MRSPPPGSMRYSRPRRSCAGERVDAVACAAPRRGPGQQPRCRARRTASSAADDRGFIVVERDESGARPRTRDSRHERRSRGRRATGGDLIDAGLRCRGSPPATAPRRSSTSPGTARRRRWLAGPQARPADRRRHGGRARSPRDGQQRARRRRRRARAVLGATRRRRQLRARDARWSSSSCRWRELHAGLARSSSSSGASRGPRRASPRVDRADAAGRGHLDRAHRFSSRDLPEIGRRSCAAKSFCDRRGASASAARRRGAGAAGPLRELDPEHGPAREQRCRRRASPPEVATDAPPDRARVAVPQRRPSRGRRSSPSGRSTRRWDAGRTRRADRPALPCRRSRRRLWRRARSAGVSPDAGATAARRSRRRLDSGVSAAAARRWRRHDAAGGRGGRWHRATPSPTGARAGRCRTRVEALEPRRAPSLRETVQCSAPAAEWRSRARGADGFDDGSWRRGRRRAWERRAEGQLGKREATPTSAGRSPRTTTRRGGDRSGAGEPGRALLGERHARPR